jgi:hypothetical protein
MNKALIAFLWIATAVLSYWLGSGKGSDSDNHKSENQSLTSNSVSIEDKAEEKHHPKPKVSSLMTAVDESIDSGVMVTQPQLEEKIVANAESDFPSLEERIQSSNMITRLRAFTELLEEGSSQSIEQAREIYEKLPAGPQRYSELRLLAYGWGQKDPESALEWATGLEGTDQRIGTGTVLDSWARYDSAGAIAWARENFEGEDNPYYVGIISGMSDKDLFGATELMTTLPYGRIRGHAASNLVEKTWQMGEDVAIHFADNLPEGSIQNFAFGQIAKKIAKDDLGRAVQWVEKMDESEVKVRVSEDVAERWAKQNPEDAAEWVSRMPEGEARSESMEEVVTQWARKDPTATAEWLNQFPSGELMDEPIQRFVREVARKDPDSALTWAQSITNEERRKKVEADVLNIKVMQAQRQQFEAVEGSGKKGAAKSKK